MLTRFIGVNSGPWVPLYAAAELGMALMGILGKHIVRFLGSSAQAMNMTTQSEPLACQHY